MTLREDVRRWLIQPLGEVLVSIDTQLRSLRELATRREPTPQPAPLVVVFAEGKTREGAPMTLGAMANVEAHNTTNVELRTQWELTDVRILVVCDLRAVDLHGIFCGVDLVTANLAACPVGRVPVWTPGVLLNVSCRRRT